jgi:hypothetical protein
MFIRSYFPSVCIYFMTCLKEHKLPLINRETVSKNYIPAVSIDFGMCSKKHTFSLLINVNSFRKLFFICWHSFYYLPLKHIFFFINPLKPKLVRIMFKNSVCTSKKTQHFSISKINWQRLFKEIIAVYSENQIQHNMMTTLNMQLA